MGKVCRLRPIKILVASLDPRFERVVSFLLRRYGFEVLSARQPARLNELAVRHGVTLAVVDTDNFPDLRAQLETLDVGVVVIGEHGEAARSRNSGVLPKWGPFQQLRAELDRLLVAAAPAATARAAQSRSPVEREAAAVIAQRSGPRP